jgi:uncharacterized membrane protein YeiB
MKRLAGLDLARYLALIGMIVVNFDVVMVKPLLAEPTGFASLLQGRAAALFVVLAGIGFGLAAQHKSWQQTFRLTSKRFIFLLLLGLLNALIFQADIIHYYAFYFLVAVFLLPLSNRLLIISMIAIVIISFIMLLTLNYDQGWDWHNYHYQDFWTVTGFIRNLFFNGWHPIFPWLVFLLMGIIISRLKLHAKRLQIQMLVIGLLLFSGITLLSQYLIKAVSNIDAEAAILFATTPIPPTPLYLLAAGGLAVTTIAFCLLIETKLTALKILALVTPAGKQTLTGYIAHIILGMGLLEGMDKLANQTPNQALFAAFVFITVLTVTAYLWSKKFKRGPLETLMRQLTG